MLHLKKRGSIWYGMMKQNMKLEKLAHKCEI